MKNVPALSVMSISFRSRILRFVKRWSSCRQNWGFSNIIRQYTSDLNIIWRFQKLRCLVRSSVTVRRDPLRSLRILPQWSTSTKFLAIARKQCGSLRDCRWLVNKCQSGWSTSSTISSYRCMIFYWKSWKGSDFFMWMKHLIILASEKANTYYWVVTSGKFEEKNITVFTHSEGRSSETAKKLLSDFNGYVQTDGYAGYNFLDGTRHLGCLAHVRRYFVDSLKNSSYKASKSFSGEIVKDIDEVFELERKLSAKFNDDERLNYRRRKLLR